MSAVRIARATRVLCVGLSCSGLLLAGSAIAGPIPAADARQSVKAGTVAPASPVSRLVVRLVPGAYPAGGAAVSAELATQLETALGRSLAGVATRENGDLVLTLAEPASALDAKRLVGVLRMRREVLRADADRSEDPGNALRAKAAAAADPRVRVKRLIVRFGDPALADVARRNGRLGPEWDERLSAAAGVSVRVDRPTVGGAWLVRLPAAVDGRRAQDLAARLEAADGVRSAEPDYPQWIDAYFPDDSYYQSGYQRSMANPLTTSYFGIDAPEAWDITVGSPIAIAVVDTGILYHPDLQGRILPGYDFISDPFSANDGDARDPTPYDWGNWRVDGDCYEGSTGRDSDWHGTHVAGIIGANGDNGIGVAGINWVAGILPVRVLGKCGGNVADIAEGVAWAAGLPVPGVPDNPYPARVINMSLGGEGNCPDIYQNTFDDALARGAFIAVAGGNESDSIENHKPANCYGVSTVIATDPYGYRASYSNYGVNADIAAPGGDQSRYGHDAGIWSTLNDGTTDPGNDTYAPYNGTSQATPHVAGVASLMLAVNPGLTPAQIKTIQAETSSYFAKDSVCRTDNNCGAGIVNAYYAVKEARRLASLPLAPAVEYYNPARDHYFISSAQPEIDALDSGRFPGWVRTGLTFNVYTQPVAGASGVCRFYIPAAFGDSHFYTASPAECALVRVRYPAFVYESAAVFYVALPDPVTGACPAGDVPVFRLFDNRADGNHRYTTDVATRNQMLARGWQAEGYGPNAVIMCSPQ